MPCASTGSSSPSTSTGTRIEAAPPCRRVSSACHEHAVVKTLVMEDETKRPLVVLMHGDREVSTKQLARQIGAKTVKPCAPEVAERHTGYQVGGTSPFGTRKPLPVYVERSILELERIYLNGGRRGLLVSRRPADSGRGAAAPRSSMSPSCRPVSVRACRRPTSRQLSRAATFAQVSLSETVRLNTGAPGWPSGSAAK